MASISELESLVNQWAAKLRLHQAGQRAWQGATAGMALGLGLAFYGALHARVLQIEVVVLVLSSTGAGAAFAWLAAFYKKRPILESARHFDRIFSLKERTSTALELAHSHIVLHSGLVQRQYADALLHAQQVHPSDHFPRLRRLPSVVMLILMGVFTTMLWFYGENLFQAAEAQRAVEETIAQQIMEVEALRDEIQKNERLNAEQRQALVQPLDEALQGLEKAQSLEEALALLNEAEQQLQALEDGTAAANFQGLREAGELLSKNPGERLDDFAESLAQGDLLQAAQDLREIDPGTLNPDEIEELADKLEKTAELLEPTNPELAQQLSEAAEALQQTDAQNAEQALEQAAETLEQLNENLEMAQAAEDAAEQLDQAEQQMAENSGMESSGSGEQSTSGSGAGELGQQPDGQTGSLSLDENGEAGDGGTTDYEQIYAAQGPQDQSEQGLQLPESGQAGDTNLGEIGSNPTEGEPSLVPYSEVFAEYEDIFRAALENGEIPLFLRQLIKEYFSALEP
ncbi:MAG: hypothetical protein OEZ02_05930 [Anaerolineae bacterium]|nr:hypothetical protein [Anaerolineae bacterium]